MQQQRRVRHRVALHVCQKNSDGPRLPNTRDAKVTSSKIEATGCFLLKILSAGRLIWPWRRMPPTLALAVAPPDRATARPPRANPTAQFKRDLHVETILPILHHDLPRPPTTSPQTLQSITCLRIIAHCSSAIGVSLGCPPKSADPAAWRLGVARLYPRLPDPYSSTLPELCLAATMGFIYYIFHPHQLRSILQW